MTDNQFNRIVVIGTSCSGKTTLARNIADRLKIPHIELDAIHWLPEWQMRPRDEFRSFTREAVAIEEWALDGNYSKVRDITWGRATTLIWLNYPFHIVWYRALSRTCRRVFDRQELFSGNRETFRQSFFSKDSILVWVLQTYARRRREYPLLFQQQEYKHLQLIELQHPKQAKLLLETLSHNSPLNLK